MNNPNTPAVTGGHDTAPTPITGELVDTRSTGVAAIADEAAVIQQAATVVPVLVDGGMAPAIYTAAHRPTKGAQPQGRETAIAKAMAAAVYGATLGFGVAKSLQNVFTVHGQPSIYARTAVALVLSHGHEVWTVDASATSVTVAGRRRGSDIVEESTWTIERATTAGFTSNTKYTSQPEEMLWAKAAMTVCRRLFPDVLEGVPYSVEELELDRPVTATAERVDRPRGARGTGRGRGAAGARAALAAAVPSTAKETPVQRALSALDTAPDAARLVKTVSYLVNPAAGVPADEVVSLLDRAQDRAGVLGLSDDDREAVTEACVSVAEHFGLGADDEKGADK